MRRQLPILLCLLIAALIQACTCSKEETGMVVSRNPNEAQFIIMAQEALSKYVTDNHLNTVYNVHKINKVTTKVYVGTLTQMDFIGVSLGCYPHNEHFECNEISCHAELWTVPWDKERHIQIKCVKMLETCRNCGPRRNN